MMKQLFVIKKGNSLTIKIYGAEYELVMPEGVKVEFGKKAKAVRGK